MPLIVEDGTIIKDANSYVSLDEAETYFSEHGLPDSWISASYSQKVSALLYGTRYIDNLGGFLGYPIVGTQSLLWPRVSIGTDFRNIAVLGAVQTFVLGRDNRIYTGIPQILKEATLEAALTHLTYAINAVQNSSDVIKSEKVGDIEVSYAVSEKSFPPVIRKYISKLLSPIRGGSSISTFSTSRGF